MAALNAYTQYRYLPTYSRPACMHVAIAIASYLYKNSQVATKIVKTTCSYI